MTTRRRGFTVGDRVQGKTGQIGQKRGYVLEILNGSRIKIKWDDGVTEVRAVDQIDQYFISPPPSTISVELENANDSTCESCEFPGCRENVFIFDPDLNLNLCHVHVDAQKSDVLKARQIIESDSISVSSGEDSDDEAGEKEINRILARMPASCITKQGGIY